MLEIPFKIKINDISFLFIFQPIMALFRPPVDHKNRPIFNWAHFSVGTAAHITSGKQIKGLLCHINKSRLINPYLAKFLK